ncbi:MAG: potassium channel family protein [Candidatus Saccharimonadales bacterium]
MAKQTQAQKDKAEYEQINLQFKATAGIAATMIGLGTVFYHIVEHFKWLDSLYFCVVTLATVGYGDFVPKTDLGKAFTIFYILVGVGIIATFANLLIKKAALKRHIEKADNKNA